VHAGAGGDGAAIADRRGAPVLGRRHRADHESHEADPLIAPPVAAKLRTAAPRRRLLTRQLDAEGAATTDGTELHVERAALVDIDRLRAEISMFLMTRVPTSLLPSSRPLVPERS